MKYVDPDGRKLRKLDERQKVQVDQTIITVTRKLDYIINELLDSYNNGSELNSNILSAGRKYLKSTFGEDKSDYLRIALKLQKIKIGIHRLNSGNLFYQDSDEAYGSYIGQAFPPLLCNFIELTQSFFEENSSGGWTNQEGTLIHEVSHNLFILHTNLTDKETYSAYNARNYLPDEGNGAKQNNASNWEFFYYEIFDPKDN